LPEQLLIRAAPSSTPTENGPPTCASRRARRRSGEGLRGDPGEREVDAGVHREPGFVDLHVHLREPGDEERDHLVGTAPRPRRLHRGGRDAKPARRSTTRRWCRRAAHRGGEGSARSRRRLHHHRREGRELAPMGEMYASGAHLHRRRRVRRQRGRHAPRAAVRQVAARRGGRQHAEDETLAAAVDARRRVVEPLGIPGRPSVAETVIVAATSSSRRHRHPVHFCTAPRPARSRSSARPSGAPAVTPRRRRITSPSPTSAARIRPGFRCTRRCAVPTTSPRCAPASPTAPSMPSPPTTRPTLPSRRSGRSRGAPGCSPRDVARPRAHRAGRARHPHVARRARRALVAPGAHRWLGTQATRWRRADRPTWPSSTPPCAGCRRRSPAARPATRPSRAGP